MAEIAIDPAMTWVAVNFTCTTCAGTGQVQIGTPGTMPTASRCDACGGGGVRTAPLTLSNLRLWLAEHPESTPVPDAAPVAAPVEELRAAPETTPLPETPGTSETTTVEGAAQ